MFQRDQEREVVEDGAVDIVTSQETENMLWNGPNLRAHACITSLALSTSWGTVRNLDVIINVRFILN